MLKPIRRLLERNALTIAISLTLIVTFLSLVSLKGVAKLNISNSDKYGHIIAYIALGLSWFHVFKDKKKWIFIAITLIIFGMVLEALQGTLTSYRTADWRDGLANASGVIIAYFVSILGYKKQEN